MRRIAPAIGLMLAGLGWGGGAAAQPLAWDPDLAHCHDAAIEQKRAAVVVFYDRGTGRMAAEELISRLKTSPRMQAISGLALWCRGDVDSGVVPRNFAKALKVDAYPTISILHPRWSMIDEAFRVIPAGVPQDAIERVIDKGVRQVAADQPPPWMPPKHY